MAGKPGKKRKKTVKKPLTLEDCGYGVIDKGFDLIGTGSGEKLTAHKHEAPPTFSKNNF